MILYCMGVMLSALLKVLALAFIVAGLIVIINIAVPLWVSRNSGSYFGVLT